MILKFYLLINLKFSHMKLMMKLNFDYSYIKSMKIKNRINTFCVFKIKKNYSYGMKN